MKKLFLTICFIIPYFSAITSRAETLELNNMEELQQRQMAPREVINDSNLPDINDRDSINAFIKKRLTEDNVIIDTNFNEEDLSNSSALDVQHSEEYIQQMEENKKSIFEKIYDNAIERISNQDKQQHLELLKNQEILSTQEQKKEWQEAPQKPNFPVVNIRLPESQQQIMVPAQEHIPYMYADIEILPSGQINIDETIMIIANGQKLNNGLSRALPGYAYSRTGIIKPIDYNLNKVSVNGSEIPYKLRKDGTNIIIEPQDNYQLAPGVYTYNFHYIINRNIWDYKDFFEFYWNVSSGTWNLVISRIGAIVTLPSQNNPLGVVAVKGYPGYMNNKVNIIQGEGNSIGFISQDPLFIGEGLHLIISLAKEDFIAPDFSQKFSWFLDDYGDIIISLLLLGAITISYYLSGKQLKENKGQKRYDFKKSAALLRYFATGQFDKISYGSFLLELYKKKIIDIVEDKGVIKLIKKTDLLSNLSRKEKQAVNALFPNKESTLEINQGNNLKIKRSYNHILQSTKKRFQLFALKINSMYLCFSIGMLIIAEGAISLLQVSPLQTFSVICGGSIAMGCFVYLFNLKIGNKYLNYASKLLCAVIIFFGMVMMWLYIHLISILCLLGSIIVIEGYTKIFAQRDGLLKETIKEAQNYGEYLQKNQAIQNDEKIFINQQANILASGVSDSFPKTNEREKYYKIDIVKSLLTKI